MHYLEYQRKSRVYKFRNWHWSCGHGWLTLLLAFLSAPCRMNRSKIRCWSALAAWCRTVSPSLDMSISSHHESVIGIDNLYSGPMQRTCLFLWYRKVNSFSTTRRYRHNVKDGAWIPHYDHHLSIQSRARTHKGMPHKGTPKTTCTGPFSNTAEQACKINIQTPKGQLFALGDGHGLLQIARAKNGSTYIYLGGPLGLHNPNQTSTMNKQRKDYQNPFT